MITESWRRAATQKAANYAAAEGLSVGEPYPGATVSLVVPAQRTDGSLVAIKVQWPHHESEHEADALRRWDGNGAVRLLDQDDDLLVVEHCRPGFTLSTQQPEEALTVLISLLPRLWISAQGPFRPLQDEADAWRSSLPAAWAKAGRPFERSLLELAVDLLTDLPRAQSEAVLLHQDLHGDNVLAAEREPWLAIDPKPLAGEREFGVAPVVRSAELGHDRTSVVRRLDRLCGELDLERDRALGWTIAQTVAWSFEEEGVLERHLDVARWLAAELP